MTRLTTQEATQAQLFIADDMLIDITHLTQLAEQALAPFGLTAGDGSETTGTCALLDTGPLRIQIEVADDAADDQVRIAMTVDKQRDSEAMHPQAHVAILAELTSLLIEELGGNRVTWGPEALTLPAAKFHAAFTPMRQRDTDTVPHIRPRRVRPASAAPIAPPQPLPAFEPLHLGDIFRDDDLPQTTAPAPVSTPTRVATLAATASVAVMTPAIGLPLAAYQAVKGGDIRVATHAFTLSAVLTGAMPSLSGYLSVF